MKGRIVVVEEPGEDERATVLETLIRYNEMAGPPTELEPVAILLEDADGAAVGGLYGRILYDWLFVELLAIPEELRGHGFGTALMAQAEAIARARGCIGIWLDTYTFQARPFYEKLGFAVFGIIEDFPKGEACQFMSKRL